MIIPTFDDAVQIEWRHNDWTQKNELTVRFSASMRQMLDDDAGADECDFLQKDTVERLRKEVSESSAGTCRMTVNYVDPTRDESWKICSECGFAHYNRKYWSPVRYCPHCGRRVVGEVMFE